MKNLFEKFLELIDILEKKEVNYIIIGGMAINLHGFARNTKDIDIFLEPTKENIVKFRNALKQIFNDKEIDEITYEELNKYAVIRYGTEEGFYLDIITGIGETFKFQDLKFITKTIEGVKIKFADLTTLYKLKKHTYREIDQLDLKFIEAKLNKNAD